MLVKKLDDETVGGCDIDQSMTLRHEALQEASRESYERVGVGREENPRATVPICPQGFQQRNAAVKSHDALAAALRFFGWIGECGSTLSEALVNPHGLGAPFVDLNKQIVLAQGVPK